MADIVSCHHSCSFSPLTKYGNRRHPSNRIELSNLHNPSSHQFKPLRSSEKSTSYEHVGDQFLKKLEVAKMVSQSIIRNVVGIIGNVISFFLFLSPVPTYKRICKKKTTEEFHPWPYLATTMNCIFWIFYGIPIVHPDSTLVVTINGVGLGLEIIYLTIFFYYTNSKNRRTILLVLFAEIVLLAIIAVITLVCFHTHNARSMFVGIVCIIFGTLMYFSPLSIMWTVWKTKSAEFLPFWLCFAGFCNGVCWFSYAFLKKFDPYLAITNGLGGLFGLFQIIVYAYYTLRAKSNKGSSVGDGAKTSDEQLKKNYMASPA